MMKKMLFLSLFAMGTATTVSAKAKIPLSKIDKIEIDCVYLSKLSMICENLFRI